MDRVSFNEIYMICNGTPTIRNMVEGENILSSRHLIHSGYTYKDNNIIKLFVMCLQTSELRDKPHEVHGILSFISNSSNSKCIISQMVCSCKAGASRTC